MHRSNGNMQRIGLCGGKDSAFEYQMIGKLSNLCVNQWVASLFLVAIRAVLRRLPGFRPMPR